MTRTEYNKQQLLQRIERHIDMFQNDPNQYNINLLKDDMEKNLRGTSKEFSELSETIRQLIHDYIPPYTNFINEEQHALKDVIKMPRLHTKINLYKRNFVIICLNSVIHKLKNEYHEWELDGGITYYVKNFNIDSGRIVTTTDENEAACFFKKETIDAFYEELIRQRSVMSVTKEYFNDIQGDRTLDTIIRGDWQVSKLRYFNKSGNNVIECWHYPYKDSYLPYKELV